MVLEEIKKTIDSGEEITYWEFKMNAGMHPRDFYTVLLDDPQGVQWVSFVHYESDAEYVCRYHDHNGADLSMTFKEFSRGVDEVLKKGTSELKGTSNGTLEKLSNDTVQYTTDCGMRFTLSVETLQALAS